MSVCMTATVEPAASLTFQHLAHVSEYLRPTRMSDGGHLADTAHGRTSRSNGRCCGAAQTTSRRRSSSEALVAKRIGPCISPGRVGFQKLSDGRALRSHRLLVPPSPMRLHWPARTRSGPPRVFLRRPCHLG